VPRFLNNDKLTDFMRTDWKIYGEWADIPVLGIDSWNGYYNDKTLLDMGLDFLRILMFWKENNLEVMYLSLSSEREISAAAKKRFTEDPKSFHTMVDAYLQRRPAILKRIEEIHQMDFSAASNADLNALFLETRKLIGYCGAHDWYPFGMDTSILDIVGLKEYCENHPEEKQVILSLSSPDTLLETMNEELAVLELATRCAGMDLETITSTFRDELEQLSHEYGWISALIRYPDKSPETYAQDIRNVAAHAREALAEKKTVLKKTNEKLNEYIKIYNPPQDIIDGIHAIRKLSEMRAVGEMDAIKCFNRARPLDDAIQKALGISAEDYWLLFADEVMSILTGAELPKDLAERKILVCFYRDEEGRMTPIPDAQTMWERVHEIPKQQTHMKGMSGHPGKVTGKVTIIYSSADVDHFDKGDVLVAKSTCVDYISIMKKASAIITEYGGITSHAAVVSRELGVPSVIGVPNVTSLLRDGDIVEVDAHGGIVRIH